jgi:hypothetical protein
MARTGQGRRGGRPGRLKGGTPSVLGPAAALLDTRRDQRLVGTGHPAQLGHGQAPDLVFRALALGPAEREPGGDHDHHDLEAGSETFRGSD